VRREWEQRDKENKRAEDKREERVKKCRAGE
jgi:hypothetical protein